MTIETLVSLAVLGRKGPSLKAAASGTGSAIGSTASAGAGAKATSRSLEVLIVFRGGLCHRSDFPAPDPLSEVAAERLISGNIGSKRSALNAARPAAKPAEIPETAHPSGPSPLSQTAIPLTPSRPAR